MKHYVVGLVLALLVGCSSVNIQYTKNGVTEHMKVDTKGSHVITFTDSEVTITSK